MRTTPPRALTIAGSDSGGGAGVQADLKTFLCCGVHGTSALTAVTVQNSLGVSGFYELPARAVTEQVEAVVSDIGVQATKTGMLASAAVIEAVAEVVTRLDVGAFVLDPVCASQHGDALLREDALEALRDLLVPLATLVMPNLPEARLLTGLDVRGRQGMSQAARALHAMGPGWVLIKGGHTDGDRERAVDVLFDGEREIELVADRHPSPRTHGTGDTLAAATTAALPRSPPGRGGRRPRRQGVRHGRDRRLIPARRRLGPCRPLLAAPAEPPAASVTATGRGLALRLAVYVVTWSIPAPMTRTHLDIAGAAVAVAQRPCSCVHPS